MTTEPDHHEFRMAAELRRSTIYWFVGWSLILLPVAIVLRARILGFQWLPAIGVTIAFLGIGSPLLLAFRWRDIYKLPVVPAVPDEWSLAVGFRQKWRLTYERLALTIGKKTEEYHWEEVRRIEVHRLEH